MTYKVGDTIIHYWVVVVVVLLLHLGRLDKPSGFVCIDREEL